LVPVKIIEELVTSYPVTDELFCFDGRETVSRKE